MMRLVLAGLAATVFSASTGAAACREDVVQLRGDWGQAQFRVELADDPAERQQGLMFRKSMSRGAGMLFVYENERSVGFWMRNTFIALDMIFADGAGVVQHVHHNAVPLDETVIPGGDAIQHVLEINAGLAEGLGIVPGSQLRHPAIDQARAAWVCD